MQQDRIGMVYQGVTPDATLQGYGLGWWVDRTNVGVVADAGAYGAMPFIDNPRRYAAFLLLEKDSTVGTKLRTATKPLLDAIIDGATAQKL